MGNFKKGSTIEPVGGKIRQIVSELIFAKEAKERGASVDNVEYKQNVKGYIICDPTKPESIWFVTESYMNENYQIAK